MSENDIVDSTILLNDSTTQRFYYDSFILLILLIIILRAIIILFLVAFYSLLFLFCDRGQQPVMKGLTESCTMILIIMLFFSIQVPVSKSLLSPIKLFFLGFFVHVLLSSQSQLLQYTSQSQLILHLMHLQQPGLQSLPSCPTFL